MTTKPTCYLAGPAVFHPAAKALFDYLVELCGKAGLQVVEGRPHGGMGGHDARRGTHIRRPDRRGVDLPGVQSAGHLVRLRGVPRVVPGGQHPERHGPVQGSGIEIGQAIVPSQALGDRPLAGRGGSVDGDDEGSAGQVAHASVIAAPRLAIRAPKPGKLVAIISGSSTVTGAVLARPSTRWAMAIR